MSKDVKKDEPVAPAKVAKPSEAPNPPHPHPKLAIGDPNPLKAAPEANPVVDLGPNKHPWEEDVFRKKVMAVGFPCDVNDSAFLAALHRFSGG